MRPVRRGVVAALLALALLAAQALGLAHRGAHGPQGAVVPPAAAGLPVPGGVATVATAPVVVDAAATSAFDAHEPGGVECRLIDQASHLDVLLAAPWPALPPRVPAPLPAAAHTARTAGATPAYLARGPPRGEGEARRIVHA